MTRQDMDRIDQELFRGTAGAGRQQLADCLGAAEPRKGQALLANRALWEELCRLDPKKRIEGLRFLLQDDAIGLFGSRGYLVVPTLERVATYLATNREPLPLARLVRKLKFFLIKHGYLGMRGFIDRFDFDHLVRAFTTRVLHMLTLDQHVAFNIPLWVDPETGAGSWPDKLSGRIRKCWLVSVIDRPQRAQPSPQAMGLSTRFNRFTDLNYRALYYLSIHDKTVGTSLSCLDSLERMLRCYLELFYQWNPESPLEDVRKRIPEAEIFLNTRTRVEESLRSELELDPAAQLPQTIPLPPQTEALLMAYDGEKANRYIYADLKDLDQSELDHVSVSELINILHQKGLASGPKLFDELRQPGGRVITEISHDGIGDKARRTNDFITFVDLRESRRGGSIPFSVRVIVDAVTRNANIIPDSSRLKIVIYASELETHLDIRIGGHSARVHYSLAPPERGGRFALIYAEGGDEVGNLRRLELMTRAFRKAGLKVEIKGQMMEAIYDKDCGATTLDTVREKAALGLQILNSMPDLDYALAGFNGTYTDDFRVNLYGFFEPAAIDQLLEAWAQHCFENGFFFLKHLRPVHKEQDHFYERSELYWDGKGPYSDPYLQLLKDFRKDLESALKTSVEWLGLSRWADPLIGEIPFGQVLLDRLVDLENRALRHSLLLINERGYVEANPIMGELRQHPVTLFIDYLKTDELLPVLSKTAHLAGQVANLGSWEDLGKLGGLWVSRLRISTIKDALSFFILRAPESQNALLAFATVGEDPLPIPFIDRVAERVRPSNIITATDWIALILNLFGYRVDTEEAAPAMTWEHVRGYLNQPNPPDLDVASVLIPGIIASRGVRTGRLRANRPDRPADEFRDGVLIDDFLTPEDDPKIQSCRAVVITGGGELSHAAIRTREFRKPSLILKDIHFRDGKLTYQPHYNRESMTCFPFALRDIQVHACYCPPGNQQTINLRDGDLVRIDADRGNLQALGNSAELQNAFERILALEKKPDDPELWAELNRDLNTHASEDVVLLVLSECIFCLDLAPERLREVLASARSNREHGPKVNEYLQHHLKDIRARLDSFFQKKRLQVIRSSSPMELFYHLGTAVTHCEKVDNVENVCGSRLAALDHMEPGPASLCDLARERLQRYRPEIQGQLAAEARRADIVDGPDRSLLMTWKRLVARSREVGLQTDPAFVKVELRLRGLLEQRADRLGRLMRCELVPGTDQNPFFISKDELDSDYRPLVGGKAAHSGDIGLILQDQQSEAIHVPAGFAATICLGRLFQAGSKDDWVATVCSELAGLVRAHSRAQLRFYDGLLRERRMSSVTDTDSWRSLSALLEEPELESERLQRQLDSFTAWLRAEPAVLSDHRLMAFAQVFGRLAVRSSGVREDSRKESFAGQKLTLLNVLGPVSVFHALERVFASGAEAVLVEEMIPAQVSGVAFSVHPGTGNFGRIIVNSAYGLGEAVVSGLVDPDTLILDKKLGRMMGQPVIGSKLMRIVPAVCPGADTTEQEPVPVELRKQLSLPVRQQQQLVAAVRTLEDYFGYPLDVEWAVDPLGRFYVLQSRPITTLWEMLERGKSFYEGWQKS